MANQIIADILETIDNAEIADFFSKIEFYQSEAMIEVTDVALLNNLRKEFLFGKSGYDFFDKLKIFVNHHLKTVHSNPLQQVKNNLDYSDYIGLVIDNFKIISLIGFGGFGFVFRAKHIYLNNEVALKVSYEIQTDYEKVKELMQNGLSGIRQLEHPYIIKTLSMGEVNLFNSPRIYVITEIIKSGNLDFLPKNHLTKNEIKDRIKLFIKICEGINFAHNFEYLNQLGFLNKGVMHGDIKPQNILLDEKQNPKIIDFMFIDLNKLVEIKIKQPDFFSDKFYSVTSTFGSEGYMAPEQKNDGIVYKYSDIFGLGATFFELFSNVKFGDIGHNFVNNSSEQVSKHIHEHLKTQNNNIIKPISNIIAKCTANNLDIRYNVIEELLKYLNKLQHWRYWIW